jgi:hypothetical protein
MSGSAGEVLQFVERFDVAQPQQQTVVVGDLNRKTLDVR